MTELLNFRDAYGQNTPLRDLMPALVAARPAIYESIGLKDLCTRVHAAYGRFVSVRPQDEIADLLPPMVMRPSDAHDQRVRGQVESVDLDDLMNRIVAVPLVQTASGVPLLMPGERLTRETASLHRYLQRARQFDVECPAVPAHVSGVQVTRDSDVPRYLVPCLKE